MIQGSGRWAVVGIEVGHECRGLAPVSNQHDLVPRHVARRHPHRDPRQHVPIAFEKPPARSRGDRLEVRRQVAGAGALVGLSGEVELAFLHHVGGVREGRPDVAPWVILQIGIHRGVPAGMVEMEMGVDHPFDVPRKKPGGSERILQLRGALPAPSSRPRRCRGTSRPPCCPVRCRSAPARRSARPEGSASRAGSDGARLARPACSRVDTARRRTSRRHPGAGSRPRGCDSADCRP